MTSHYLSEEASAERIEALVDRLVSETVLQWPQSSDYHLVPDSVRSIVRSRVEARLRANVNQESRE